MRPVLVEGSLFQSYPATTRGKVQNVCSTDGDQASRLHQECGAEKMVNIEKAVALVKLATFAVPHEMRLRIRLFGCNLAQCQTRPRLMRREFRKRAVSIAAHLLLPSFPSGCSGVMPPFLQGGLLFRSSCCVKWKELRYCPVAEPFVLMAAAQPTSERLLV